MNKILFFNILKMHKIHLAFVLVICCFSCKKEKGPVAKICTPPSIVSYQQHIQPIFNSHCIDAGCHSGTNPAGHLNLESSVSYTKLMKPGSGYIDTLQPAFSLLYAQMNSVSNPMPPSGRLDDCTVGLVLKWIQQKAKNN